jgi:hypothetical protein
VPRRIAIELDDVLVLADSRPWASLDEKEPRAVARLAETAAARRWEIIFLTTHSRESHATEQVDAQRWLESKGFTLPCVYVAPGPRGPIASSLHLDLVIDARPKNCVEVVTESDARALLVWTRDSGALPADARRPEITIAKSFGECLDMLTAVEDPKPQGDGLLAWVRRLFGGKAASSRA